ncbi:general odorant-binding protein 83a-like [Anoplophora glabripennis]|uniref:general odorant-binding protein 83a-like n=1 Tax=Anoplophora glabripennis TaxID=217634 RepID=UPI00087557E7|nr:general odorant-binding protein 83a-like [Anoplophora glabripennis]
MNHLVFLVASLLTVASVQAVLDQAKFSPKLLELSKTVHGTCVSKSGTDEASIKKVINGEFTDEPKIKVYMRCILTESGVITDEKGLNVELATQLLPSEVKDEVLANTKTCLAKIKGITNKEDRVFNFFKCFYGLNPNILVV